MIRILSCNSCDHIWSASGEAPKDPVHCPRCNSHVCACGCGANLNDQRADALWKDRSCYMGLQRASGGTSRAARANIARTRDRVGSRGGNVRDLDEARGLQEEGEEKARWTLIVREQITRTLVETGYFHADDVAPLGVPEQHCNIIGSQIASFVSRKLMESTGVTRKVAHKAANSRKAPIYRITSKGREELIAGVSASPAATRDASAFCDSAAVSTACAHPGEQSCPTGAPSPQGEDRSDKPEPVPSAGSAAGGGSGVTFHAPGPAARLFDDSPPSAFDPWSEAA